MQLANKASLQCTNCSGQSLGLQLWCHNYKCHCGNCSYSYTFEVVYLFNYSFVVAGGFFFLWWVCDKSSALASDFNENEIIVPRRIVKSAQHKPDNRHQTSFANTQTISIFLVHCDFVFTLIYFLSLCCCCSIFFSRQFDIFIQHFFSLCLALCVRPPFSHFIFAAMQSERISSCFFFFFNFNFIYSLFFFVHSTNFWCVFRLQCIYFIDVWIVNMPSNIKLSVVEIESQNICTQNLWRDKIMYVKYIERCFGCVKWQML